MMSPFASHANRVEDQRMVEGLKRRGEMEKAEQKSRHALAQETMAYNQKLVVARPNAQLTRTGRTQEAA